MSYNVLHPHTAVINKQQKQKAKQSRQEALQWLCKQFPILFDTTESIKPLKKGILADILQYEAMALEAGVSKTKIRQALANFARRVDYLACLKAREMRLDLAGNPTEPVTEEEAERASMKLRKRIEKSSKNARRLHTTSTLKISSDFPAYGTHNTTAAQKPARAVSVTVKHKSTRTFDPNAVARLKEKLGLSAAKSEEIE